MGDGGNDSVGDRSERERPARGAGRLRRTGVALGVAALLVGLLVAGLARCAGRSVGDRREPEPGLSRGLGTKANAPMTVTLAVTNSLIISDVTGLVTYTTDIWVRWSPPLTGVTPLYYEVWHSDAPYFEPGECVSCTLAATTALTNVVVAAPQQMFNPCYGVAGCDIGSGLDFYRVRSRTTGGATPMTKTLGVMTWSLDQGDVSMIP